LFRYLDDLDPWNKRHTVDAVAVVVFVAIVAAIVALVVDGDGLCFG
jgi:hypothetical protein